MSGVRGNRKFLAAMENTRGFKTYFELSEYIFTSIILGFYKHLGNLKKI